MVTVADVRAVLAKERQNAVTDAQIQALIDKHSRRISYKKYEPGDLGVVDPWNDENWLNDNPQARAIKQAGGVPYVVLEEGNVVYFQWHNPFKQGYFPVRQQELNAIAQKHVDQVVIARVVTEL
mgnify:CR=1 FL=1